MPYNQRIHKMQAPDTWDKPWSSEMGVCRRLTVREIVRAYLERVYALIAIDLIRFKMRRAQRRARMMMRM